MVILGRIVMVFIGYGLACVAAAIVFTIGTLTPAWDDLGALGVQSVALWSIVGVAAAFIWGVALLPALLIIALAEGLALRSSVRLSDSSGRRIVSDTLAAGLANESTSLPPFSRALLIDAPDSDRPSMCLVLHVR